MGSGNKNDVKNEINTEQQRVNDQFGALYNTMEEKRLATEQRSNAERDILTGTLTPIATSGMGGLDPTVTQNIRNLYGGKTVGYESGTSGGNSNSGGDSSGGSSGGGSAAPVAPVNPWSEPESIYRNMGQTGGIEIEKLRSQVAELENMARTGAIDPAAQGRIQETINQLKNFQFDPAAKARIDSTISQLDEIGRTGGYDPNRLAAIRGDIDSLRSWAQTGGVDADRLASARGNIDFMQGGGISDADLGRWRGTGYDEFARTGGWSDTERADFRDRATSAIPAMYRTQADEAARLTNIQGGGGAGLLAAASRANRQGAQNLATAARDAEIDLGGAVREGRRWGIEGIANTEAAIQERQGANRGIGLTAGNQLELGVGANRISGLTEAARAGTTLEQNIASNRIGANEVAGKLKLDTENAINDAFIRAKQGAGSIEANLEQAISQNRIAAQKAATEAESTAQRLRQEGQLAGAQGLMSVAAQKEAQARAAEASAGAARANDQANERWWAQFVSGNERWIGEQGMQGQQNALRNLTQVYGMDPTLPRDSMQLDIASQQAGATGRLLGIDAQNSAGGKDWTDWARFGLGAAQGLGFGGGRTDVNSRGGGYSSDMEPGWNSGSSGYDYDSDNPNSIWYDGGQGGGGNNPAGGTRPSDDQWWIDNGL